MCLPKKVLNGRTRLRCVVFDIDITFTHSPHHSYRPYAAEYVLLVAKLVEDELAESLAGIGENFRNSRCYSNRMCGINRVLDFG